MVDEGREFMEMPIFHDSRLEAAVERSFQQSLAAGRYDEPLRTAGVTFRLPRAIRTGRRRGDPTDRARVLPALVGGTQAAAGDLSTVGANRACRPQHAPRKATGGGAFSGKWSSS